MTLLPVSLTPTRYQSTTRKVITAAFTLLSFTYAGIASAYTIEDAPDWVQVTPSPAPIEQAKYRANDGVFYRLYDRQINAIDPQNRSSYKALEYELTNRAGVESRSTIEIHYDPNYESVVIHELGIIRKGKYLDRLTETSYEQLRTEGRLDELLYDGTTTLAAILKDVRVGDVIRHSYTIKGANPVYEDIVEYGVATQYYSAIGEVGFRIQVDANTNMFVRQQDLDNQANIKDQFSLSESVANGIRTYSWNSTDPKELKDVENEPVWTEFDPAFSISSVGDWDDIVAWSLPHYNKPNMQSEQVKQIAREIKAEHKSEAAYIGAALQWVQDEIRYFGVELGENSHNPSHPDETLARRFGDCKDKALLLIAILDELDVKAQPALVNTRERLRRSDYIYRLHAFNHVIVHVERNGESHWIDPTSSYQTGKLGDFHEPDYGYALVIDNDVSALSAMGSKRDLYKMTVRKQLTMTEASKTEGEYSIRTERAALSAESHRSRISNQGIDELSDSYLEYYRDIYGTIDRIEPMRFTEASRNRNFTFEHYGLKNVWHASGPEDPYFEVSTEEIQHYLKTPKAPEYRERAYYLGHGVKISENTKLYLPEIQEDGTYTETISNDYFDYALYIRQKSDEKSIVISHTFILKSMSVPREALLEFVADAKAANDMLSWNVAPNGLTWSDNSEENSEAAANVEAGLNPDVKDVAEQTQSHASSSQ